MVYTEGSSAYETHAADVTLGTLYPCFCPLLKLQLRSPKMKHTILTEGSTTSSSAVKNGLTIIVPAYNEAAAVGDTIHSLQNQTTPPEEIIVVDDCSSDGTGEIASALGVTVVCPPTNTGSKAGAQTLPCR